MSNLVALFPAASSRPSLCAPRVRFADFVAWLRDVQPEVLRFCAVVPDAIGLLASSRATPSQHAWALRVLTAALTSWADFGRGRGLPPTVVSDALERVWDLVGNPGAPCELCQAAVELEDALGL